MTPLKTYEVTGELTPDATGTYEDAGEYEGKRYYARNGFFIWWDGSNTWKISTILGSTEVEHYGWWREDPDIEGDYESINEFIGTATVTEI